MLMLAKNCEGNTFFKFFLFFFSNYVRYLVSVPSFKCLAFSHQKQGVVNLATPRANTMSKY